MAVPVTDMIVSTAEDGVVAETTSINDPNLAMAQSDVNNVLLEIISRFSGATYAGVATPETDPGDTPSQSILPDDHGRRICQLRRPHRRIGQADRASLQRLDVGEAGA